MRDIWPASGFRELQRDDHGWLVPTDAYLRSFLALPQLALVEESCDAERQLHASLLAAPTRAVDAARARSASPMPMRATTTRTSSRFRDALLAAGTLEAWYLAVFRAGAIDLPPLFIDRVAEAIVRNVVDGADDAQLLRAAELLYRPQRIAVQDGRVLAADRETADRLSDPAQPRSARPAAAPGAGRGCRVRARDPERRQRERYFERRRAPCLRPRSLAQLRHRPRPRPERSRWRGPTPA